MEIGWAADRAADGKALWLEYCHFSTLWDTNEKVVLISIANIDRSQDQQQSERNFKKDPNVAEDLQYGEDWYKRDDWDKGHMTRRETIGWGSTDEEARIAMQHSDYFTNMSPQHTVFHAKVWGPLVEAPLQTITETSARSKRCLELTGAAFDASKTAPPLETDTTVANGSHETRNVPNTFWKGMYWVDEETGELCKRFWWTQQSSNSRLNTHRDATADEVFEWLGFAETLSGTSWLTAKTA